MAGGNVSRHTKVLYTAAVDKNTVSSYYNIVILKGDTIGVYVNILDLMHYHIVCN